MKKYCLHFTILIFRFNTVFGEIKNGYQSKADHLNFNGHDPNDLSGKSAALYEKIFWKEYAHFLKTTNEKVQNPLVLMGKIRKNLPLQ